MLNAGRGNPNWIAMTPRQGFFQLGLFAVEESQRKPHRPRLGSTPEKKGIAGRFEKFTGKHSDAPGVGFLREAFVYAHNELKIDPDEFVREMVDAILGDHYPIPDRMLISSEKIVHKYLEQEMCGGSGEIDKRPEFFSWYKQLNLRAYRATNQNILGKTVSELEALFPRKIAVEKLVKHLGYPERPTVMTDLVIVGLGCVLGTLIGLIMVPVMGIPLTLGVGGGVLLSGLVFGWLRSGILRHSRYGKSATCTFIFLKI